MEQALGVRELTGSVRQPLADTSLDQPEKIRAISLLVIGTSFKTSPIAFRERLLSSLSGGRVRGLIHNLPYVKESALLTTCNRIEVYFATQSPDSTSRAFFALIKKFVKLDDSVFYQHRNIEAITHLFSVSSGLDSMVLGEEQIIEQVREAGINERLASHAKAILSALFDASYGSGRRIRSFSSRKFDASISVFALKLALRKLGHKPRKTLLIGTGKTIRLATNEVGDSEIYVATSRNSLPPTLKNCRAINHRDIGRLANGCDLIISATKHRGYLLKKTDLKDRPRVVLDLAFPRNVDPGLRTLESTALYDLDDLAREAGKSSNLSRYGEEERREVEREAGDFQRWLLASKLSPSLASLHRWAESVRAEEVNAILMRLHELSERDRQTIEVMSKRLVSKLLSKPTSFAKRDGNDISQEERLRLVEKVFMLEG